MNEALTESQINLLQHIHGGGMVALCIYGKRTKTIEVLSSPHCIDAGIMRVEQLIASGLARYGDPSPYKSGRSLPVVLTDEGRERIAHGASHE